MENEQTPSEKAKCAICNFVIIFAGIVFLASIAWSVYVRTQEKAKYERVQRVERAVMEAEMR